MKSSAWIAIFFLLLPLTTRAEGLYDPNHVQVYVVPMNDFPESLAVRLARTLSEDMGFWIKSSLRIGELNIETLPGTNQLPAEAVIARSQALIRSLPETSEHTYFLLLTLKDINSQIQGFRFQFSMHDPGLRTSVLSMARLLDYQDNRPVLSERALLRLFKLSKRAIGELHLGWRRSTDPSDIMYSPLMSVSDLDRIGIEHRGHGQGPAREEDRPIRQRGI